MTAALLAALVAAGSSAAVQPVVMRALRRLGSLDVPNHRSSHTRTVPRGGAGIALGMATGAVTYALVSDVPVGHGGVTPRALWGLSAALTGLFVVGQVDDLKHLPAWPRLVAQAAAGAVVAVGFGLPLWGYLLVVVWMVAVTNAANFMDGINGISGSTALLAGAFYAWTGLTLEHPTLMLLGGLLAGAYGGFLPYNLPVARLFMGDSGSYLLGGALASCSVLAWHAGASALVVVAPLLPYLADSGVTLLRRALKRQPLMAAHREHAYQRLAAASGSHLAATAVMAVTITVCCLAALAQGPPTVMIAVALASYLGLAEFASRTTSRPAQAGTPKGRTY